MSSKLDDATVNTMKEIHGYTDEEIEHHAQKTVSALVSLRVNIVK